MLLTISNSFFLSVFFFLGSSLFLMNFSNQNSSLPQMVENFPRFPQLCARHSPTGFPGSMPGPSTHIAHVAAYGPKNRGDYWCLPGAFFIRNTKWAFWLLDQWWAATDVPASHRSGPMPAEAKGSPTAPSAL
jgi:hypothetical protein